MGGVVSPVAQPAPQVTPVAAQEEAVRAVPVPAIVEQRKALAERIGHVPEPEEPADAATPKARVTAHPASTDRKSVVEGKCVSVRVRLGGRRILKKQLTVLVQAMAVPTIIKQYQSQSHNHNK